MTKKTQSPVLFKPTKMRNWTLHLFSLSYFIQKDTMGDHKHKKERKSSKREHSSSASSSSRDHKKHKKSSSSSRHKHEKEQEIDYSDPSLWVEAGGAAANDSGIQSEIAPADYLKRQQQANEAREQQQDDASISSMMPREQDARHGWMLDGGLDFGAMGSARIREQDKSKVNPDLVSWATRHGSIGKETSELTLYLLAQSQ